MFCINCLNNDTRVINSRTHKKTPSVWRRRRCDECKYTFTTHETVDLGFEVKNSSNYKKKFSRAKLATSVLTSLLTAGLQPADAFWLSETIEHQLVLARARHPSDILSTQQIKQMSYKVLEAYNSAAALAYGSAHNLLKQPRRPRLKRPKTS